MDVVPAVLFDVVPEPDGRVEDLLADGAPVLAGALQPLVEPGGKSIEIGLPGKLILCKRMGFPKDLLRFPSVHGGWVLR